jgi:hypothetical protein
MARETSREKPATQRTQGLAARSGKDRRETPSSVSGSDALDPILREKCAAIGSRIAAHLGRDLLGRYEIGLEIKQVHDDATKGGRKRYGARIIEQLSKDSPWGAGLIRLTLRMVKTYTKEEIEQIAKKRMAAGPPITWEHIRVLVTVKDRGRREALLAQMVNESLPAAALRAEVAKEKKQTGRGRRIAPPKSFDAVIRQQGTLIGNLLKRSDARHGERLLEKKFKDLKATDRTPERLEALQRHVENLKRLGEEVDQQRREAESVLDQFQESPPANTGETEPTANGKADRAARPAPG